ncbi:TIGR00266 family protein [Candidatus Peregrinibacteria bacterium CG10_big_fil_rev_8_21_14_0_10_55_24]|nr:MAG: TIGR00266 family protein [Candidatus Peregrinibacteria bacterium CG10_big_fil_rev_8_21_14_0_10_55_24]
MPCAYSPLLMHHELLLRPSYTALKCILAKDEEIHAESGAMLAMDATAKIEGRMKGGAWKAIKRTVLTSESFFVTTIRAEKDDTEVYLAPRATGDIEALELNGEEYIIQGGSFLASVGTIETDATFSGWKGFVSGEGVFMIKAKGTGTVFVSSFGGILKKELKPKETFVVDNGHIVAFPSSVSYHIERVGEGLLHMVTTGEGLACVFTGPGTLYLQTRNLRTFAESLNPFLRSRETGQGRGILGQIMGG